MTAATKVTAASTHIASCFKPSASSRMIEIRRDNKTPKRLALFGSYVVTEVHNGAAVWRQRVRTEEAAITKAASLGYTEVVR